MADNAVRLYKTWGFQHKTDNCQRDPIGGNDPQHPAPGVGTEVPESSAANLAATKGRYSKNPDRTKKTETPTSIRARYGPSVVERLLNPLSKLTWVISTPSAATARQPSSAGKRIFVAGDAGEAEGEAPLIAADPELFMWWIVDGL